MCACGNPYPLEADSLPIDTTITTDDVGMVVLKTSAVIDGETTEITNLSWCPHEALNIARDIEANVRLAELDRSI